MDDNVKDILKTFKDKEKIVVHPASEIPQPEVIPTGIEELDKVVLGVGGIPRGRITTLWGPYECGKSTLAGAIVANMHKNNLGKHGGVVAMFDSEGKFYPDWWRDWGVDLDRLLMFHFNCGEEAFDQMMQLFGKVDIIVLDSIASLVSKEKATLGENKQRIASEARMIADCLKDVKNGTYEKDSSGRITKMRTPKLSDTNTALIAINQVRANIGVMFGPRERMPGGTINKHLQSLLLRMDIIGYGKDRDDYGGIKLQKIRIKCDRNHYAPPKRSCDVWLNVEDHNFDTDSESYIINMAIDKGIVERRGAWVYWGKEKFHGTANFIEYVKSPEGAELKEQILGNAEIKESPEVEEVAPEIDAEPEPKIEETTLK